MSILCILANFLAANYSMWIFCSWVHFTFTPVKYKYLYSLLISFACFTVVAAGTAFMEAAKIQLNMLSSKHDAGQRYVDAGNCFKKTDMEGLLFVR